MTAWWPAALGVVLSACATVTAKAPDGERVVRSTREFGDYVEQVFRFENAVTSDLVTRYELTGDAEPRVSADLAAAEDRMQQDCRYLNEIVTASIDGRQPGLTVEQKLVETIGACDRSAHEVANIVYGTGHAVALKSGTSP